MRVAISQLEMHWTIDEHVRAIESALSVGVQRGAELVLFPELTLTGLHTKVPELLDRAVLEGALTAVSTACHTHQVGAAVGTPLWATHEKPQDAMVLFDTAGREILRSSKLRLMPPGEPLVFEAGEGRPLIETCGSTIAVVICREILDHAELTEELGGRAGIILWPGVMARGPVTPGSSEDYALHATRLAREQNAWILHSNWANNVQVPGLPFTGQSMVISPTGEVVLDAPAQRPGLLLAWESSLKKAWIPSPSTSSSLES